MRFLPGPPPLPADPGRRHGDRGNCLGRDDQICAVTRADFIRTPEIRYNDVLIQEFPYKENTPESVGRWRPLIEELVKLTLAKYRTLDGLARAYPQWVPEETVLPFPRQALESAEHIIFHDNGICEMIPRAGSSKANIVPPTAADCGEEC